MKGPYKAYNTLRPGWSDNLFRIIVRETNSQCIYSFKRCNIAADEFRTSGKCKECEGTIFIQSSCQRTRLSVQILKGNKPHTFNIRRRLAKETAEKLISNLKEDTVHNVHMALVNEMDIDSDTENMPRDFVSHKSLENLKYRTNAMTDSAIIELRKMKYLPQYSAAIKEICTDPFRIMFWTKEQSFIGFAFEHLPRY